MQLDAQPATLCHACAVAEVDGEPLDLLAVGLEPTLEEVLEEGVSRLKDRTTWKLWTWPIDQKEFLDGEAFRTHITVCGRAAEQQWEKGGGVGEMQQQ